MLKHKAVLPLYTPPWVDAMVRVAQCQCHNTWTGPAEEGILVSLNLKESKEYQSSHFKPPFPHCPHFIGCESEIKPKTPPHFQPRDHQCPTGLLESHVFLEVLAIFSGLSLIQYLFCYCFEHVLKCQNKLFGNDVPKAVCREGN